MDILKKLEIEIDGIIGTIESYTGEPYINNILIKLKKSINSRDALEIKYCLTKLSEWYSDNQKYIQNNEFVTDKKTHIRIEKDIEGYLIELNIYRELNQVQIRDEENIKLDIDKNKIFIVHGHDELAKVEVARFVEKLGLEAIILHEQASSGNTIIEKIEEYSNVGFGIVIYTPCDVGNSIDKKDNLNSRARQNVVFEHGYLIGKIGRKNVCALVKCDIEKPNDISGVVYINMDSNGAWQTQIVREMKKQGYQIDANNLF